MSTGYYAFSHHCHPACSDWLDNLFSTRKRPGLEIWWDCSPFCPGREWNLNCYYQWSSDVTTTQRLHSYYFFYQTHLIKTGGSWNHYAVCRTRHSSYQLRRSNLWVCEVLLCFPSLLAFSVPWLKSDCFL